jgi:hypothetical protein
MMPVTPDAGLPAPVDLANDLLAAGPAYLLTGMNGTMGVITIRTPTTTLTVQLPKADVLAWGRMVLELGESMDAGSSLLIASPGNALFRP